MSGPSSEIRIRLEGRLEVLEAAVSRYEQFQRLLKGNWRRKAIEQRKAVHEFLDEEQALNAAIDHAVRVSERDKWPADAEARQVSARIAALRRQLGARVGVTAWAEAVSRLRTVADSARLPAPDELILLEGTAARALPLWVLTLAPTLLAMAWWGGAAAVGVMVSMICLGLAVLPLGRYALLADRLVWIPYRGVPAELPLGAARQVSLIRRGSGVEIEGRLSLPVVTSPVQLAALMLLYSDGPLKGIARPPAGTVVYLPAYVSRAGADFDGFVMLHTDGLCFLPRGTAPALLKRLVPAAHELPVTESFMLEQLSRLPAAQLTEVLAEVAALPGGISVPPHEVIADPMRNQQRLRLRVRGLLLEIPLEAVDLEALRSLFPWTQDASRQVP